MNAEQAARALIDALEPRLPPTNPWNRGGFAFNVQSYDGGYYAISVRDPEFMFPVPADLPPGRYEVEPVDERDWQVTTPGGRELQICADVT